MKKQIVCPAWVLGFALLISGSSQAGEALFAKVKTAEPLPEGASELYIKTLRREDKGQGNYEAMDTVNLHLKLTQDLHRKLTHPGRRIMA